MKQFYIVLKQYCLAIVTFLTYNKFKIFLYNGYSLFPDIARHDCTVDGCHPNDLGMYFMAERIGGVLANVIKGE